MLTCESLLQWLKPIEGAIQLNRNYELVSYWSLWGVLVGKAKLALLKIWPF